MSIFDNEIIKGDNQRRQRNKKSENFTECGVIGHIQRAEAKKYFWGEGWNQIGDETEDAAQKSILEEEGDYL